METADALRDLGVAEHELVTARGELGGHRPDRADAGSGASLLDLRLRGARLSAPDTKLVEWIAPSGMRTARVPSSAVPFDIYWTCPICDGRSRIVMIDWRKRQYRCEEMHVMYDVHRAHAVPELSYCIDESDDYALVLRRSAAVLERHAGK